MSLSPQAREKKINELSLHFANDQLTLEELERRIEQVYKAGSQVELDAITADLAVAPAPAANPAGGRLARKGSKPPAPYIADHARILSFMGETRRVGRWTLPQQLEVLLIMSDTTLDLTQAIVPAGVVEINIRAVWSACKLILPPGIRVINEMNAIMASIQSKEEELHDDGPQSSGPVIRLTGVAVMAELKVVVRRREDPIEEDET